jgi:CO/xanthine dehydrogenase Mo-binding subunit
MDLIAERLGLDRTEVRERNFVRRGDIRVTGEAIDTGVGVGECMRRALAELGPPAPADPTRPTTRTGRGVACSMQPYGRSVFFADRASAWIGLEKDGTMVIRAGVTDLGAGQAASLANIAGEVLGVTVDRTSVHIGDSALTPLTGGTFATRQLYMSGNAVVKVARGLREKLEPVAAALLECGAAELDFAENQVSAHGRSISMGELSRAAEHQSVMPYHHDTFHAETGKFDPATGQGRSFPDCTHGAHAVEVEVDTATGEVRIIKYVAVHDVGRAIDMQRVEGQIQGAVAQGVGYALSEEVEVSGGVVGSTLFADYLIPTAIDLPDINAIGLELHPGKGPFGARGIGEPPIGPPPAALASAIQDAVGVRLHRLPMTPERILAALREARVDSPAAAS